MMPILPLTSRPLTAAVNRIVAHAKHAEEEADGAITKALLAQRSGLGGRAFVALITRIIDVQESVTDVAAQIRRVAVILQVVLPLVRELESFLRLVLSTAAINQAFREHLAITGVDSATQHSGLIARTLEEIRMIAMALDHLCATAVINSCVDTPRPLVGRLGDFDDLPAQAVHEINSVAAPPEVQELMELYPDAIVLEADPGHAVLGFGDIDSADHVVTVVAGVGSSDPTTWARQAERARSIAQTTGGAAVMWGGYTAPPSIPAAISPASATTGSTALREFQNTLHERNAHQRKTVLGYSYGSVVVGAAARDGTLRADAAIFAASPGVGVPHAQELNLRGSQPGTTGDVYAALNNVDPISLSTTAKGGIHGVDPADPAFGAIVLKGTGDHASYWTDPNFLSQVGEVARGRASP